MCLFDKIFRAGRKKKREEVFKIQPELADELLSLAILAPLAQTDLGANLPETLYCIDASNEKIAVVSAPIPEKCGEEIWQHSLKKSMWVKLLKPTLAYLRSRKLDEELEQLPDGQKTDRPPPWLLNVVRSLQFEEELCFPVGRREHINISETRAWLALEKLAAPSKMDSRILAAADSMVQIHPGACLSDLVSPRQRVTGRSCQTVR